MANFDVWQDSDAITDVINRPLETQFEQEPTLGEQIAPTRQIPDTEVTLEINEVEAFGKGQHRAPNATPPLVEFAGKREQRTFELVLLDEMHRIQEKEWQELQSNDEHVRRRAGVSLVDRGQMLAIRNRRLREAMRWDAFDGESIITYPNGSQLKIDYGIENKPTAAIDWSDTENSDPIEELNEWLTLTEDEIGVTATNVYMSTAAWDYIKINDKIAEKLTGTDRPLLVTRESDVKALLREGTNIILTDAGYRDVGVESRAKSSLTRYLPENKVLITTQPVVEGERIAEFISGQVLISTAYNQTAIRPGPHYAMRPLVSHTLGIQAHSFGQLFGKG
jgi:hypothetical protein